MNRVNSCSDHGHEDSTINIVIDYYYYYYMFTQFYIPVMAASNSVCKFNFKLLNFENVSRQ